MVVGVVVVEGKGDGEGCEDIRDGREGLTEGEVDLSYDPPTIDYQSF